MPFTRPKKKKREKTLDQVNFELRKLGGTPMTLTTLSLKNRITFFEINHSGETCFSFQVPQDGTQLYPANPANFQVPGC